MAARISLILGTLTAIVALLGGLQWAIGEYRAWNWRRKHTGKWLLVVGLCLLPSVVDAACSGSGVTWSCAPNTTIAQIDSSYSSATDGATFTFDTGSYTWDSTLTFSLTKGITLICSGTCSVTSSGTVFAWPSGGGTTSKDYRISGFDFSQSGGDLVWTCPGGGCSALRVNSFRFDHNSVSLAASSRVFVTGESTAGVQWVYGVFDHNTFSQPSTFNYFMAQGNDTNTPDSRSLGGGTNLFIEDNTFTTTSLDDSGAGCIDNNGGGVAYVFRFNTVVNCRILSHGTGHAWGPINQEWYGNVISYNSSCVGATGVCDGYHMIHHQGSGTYMVFGNRLTQKSGETRDTTNSVVVMHHGAGNARPGAGVCDGTDAVDGNRTPTATYAGYPCQRQPGRDIDDVLFPMFAWDNRWASDSVIQQLLVDASYGANTTKHIVANRDLYNYDAAFDGTSGVGVGALSSRPSTCTVGPDSGVGEADEGKSGVGYWATDQGTWKGATPSQGNTSVENGVLYMCTATNTWSVYYTPYTYPHPLVGGGAESGTLAFFLRSWPLALETASAVGALYHWRGAIAGVLIFLLGCGVTGASLLAHTTQRTIQFVKHASYTTAQKAAVVYLTLTKKDTDT